MRSKIVIGILIVLIAIIVLVTAVFWRKESTSGPDDGAAEDFSVTIMPIVTSRPDVSAAPTPEPVFSFIADAENPLPSLDAALTLGESARLRGTVHANLPLKTVRVSISCKHNDDEFYPYVLLVNIPEDRTLFDFSLDDEATVEGYSLDAMTRFSDLKIGLHTLKLSAMVQGGDRFIEVTRTQFNVLGEDWLRIKSSDFNGTYNAAMKFFKDKIKFLYRYQWVHGRYTIADPEWENKYITLIEAYPDGQKWKIHTDAVPYYQKALSYLQTSYVRVHGTNGDTGILPLYSLILTYEGSYVSRFTSSKKTISHHAFGTATDINAQMQPNLNQPENRELVSAELRDHLVYNGIQVENGVSYYDYSYSGSYQTTPNHVPETVINYLLFELAFYRAGFQWGHNYVSTSDAMHFTLTDDIRTAFDGANGLRKVFAYID